MNETQTPTMRFELAINVSLSPDTLTLLRSLMTPQVYVTEIAERSTPEAKQETEAPTPKAADKPKAKKGVAAKAETVEAEPVVATENVADEPRPTTTKITFEALTAACKAVRDNNPDGDWKAIVSEIFAKYDAKNLAGVKPEHWPDLAVDLGLA